MGKILENGEIFENREESLGRNPAGLFWCLFAQRDGLKWPNI